MKVEQLVKRLFDFDMSADVLVSTGETFDDVSDFYLSWGGPNSKDGESSKDAKFIYINLKQKADLSEKSQPSNDAEVRSAYLKGKSHGKQEVFDHPDRYGLCSKTSFK